MNRWNRIGIGVSIGHSLQLPWVILSFTSNQQRITRTPHLLMPSYFHSSFRIPKFEIELVPSPSFEDQSDKDPGPDGNKGGHNTIDNGILGRLLGKPLG